MPVVDPIQLAKEFWPDVTFTRQQVEILYSVRDNDETYVPAGIEQGKDFVAGFIALWTFLDAWMRGITCRILTTSVEEQQLGVLWGEIDKFIRTSKYPLTSDKGGPLIYNYHEIRRIVDGREDRYSYLKGRTCKKGEGFSGHHAQSTLLIVDEASAAEDMVYEMGTGWADRILVLGNPHPCSNFWRRAVKEGDREAKGNGHLYRKIIKIKAEDSPNVRLALAQKQAGKEPTNEILIPGLLSYRNYVKYRDMWDPVQQCIKLDAEFYEGAETLMFPPIWLNAAESRAEALMGRKRIAKAIGIDPGEGSANTTYVPIDELGVIEIVSKKTPDTSKITGEAKALMYKHQVPAEKVFLDAGGGGTQHAWVLRQDGLDVVTVAFGESVTPELHRGTPPLDQRKMQHEDRYVYENRRAQMYGMLRNLLDPALDGDFAIPGAQHGEQYKRLREQLAPIPLEYTREGRLMLLPKRKQRTASGQEDKTRTLTELIGYSPDEADALALAVYGMVRKPVSRMVQVF